jgi:hypothetical protein
MVPFSPVASGVFPTYKDCFLHDNTALTKIREQPSMRHYEPTDLQISPVVSDVKFIATKEFSGLGPNWHYGLHSVTMSL